MVDGDVNMSGDNFEEDGLIELIGDSGDVLKFVHIGTIEYKGKSYVFFSHAESEDTDSDEVVVFTIGQDNGEDVLIPVEDEVLLQKVFDKFTKELEKEDAAEDEEI